jgi:GT2 family glycosyltransferase
LKPSHLDVVIPVHGQPALLAECLTALPAACGDLDWRLVIVDDDSPQDADLSVLYEALPSRATLIKNKTNSGFPQTVNRGVANCLSALVLILNSDVTMAPGSIEKMAREFEEPEIGVVGPMLLFRDDSDSAVRPAGKIQHVGLAVDWGGRVIHPLVGWSADNPRAKIRREVQAVTGACLMTRRACWTTVAEVYRTMGDPGGGGLSTVYGMGTYEDVEYCLAVRGNGWKVIVQPEAVGQHFVGGSVIDEKTRGKFDIKRNEMIFRARCGHLLQWDEWRFL